MSNYLRVVMAVSTIVEAVRGDHRSEAKCLTIHTYVFPQNREWACCLAAMAQRGVARTKADQVTSEK